MKIRKNHILKIRLSVSGAGQNQTMTECHSRLAGRQGYRLACVFLGSSITTLRSKNIMQNLYFYQYFLYLYYTNFNFVSFKQSKECIKKFMLFSVQLRNTFQNIWPGQYVSSPRAPETSRWDLPLEWIGDDHILPASCADRKSRLQASAARDRGTVLDRQRLGFLVWVGLCFNQRSVHKMHLYILLLFKPQEMSLVSLGLSYVGMASPGMVLRFHTCVFVEPGSVPVPHQGTHTHTHDTSTPHTKLHTTQ